MLDAVALHEVGHLLLRETSLPVEEALVRPHAAAVYGYGKIGSVVPSRSSDLDPASIAEPLDGGVIPWSLMHI
jgi:glutamine synthetase adenylyltransferase